VGRAWKLSGRWLPNGWGDALRQLVLFAGVYYLYRIVRGLTDGNTVDAFYNAGQLIQAERSLGLFFEAGLQDWAMNDAQWLVDGANWMYVNSHFLVTTTFLIWLYLARNDTFYFVRNMFCVAMVLALVGYVLYPTAPPRFFESLGFTDTVTAWAGQSTSQTASLLYNPFAAVPSMHVAFALMIAIPAIRLTRIRTLQVVWGLYPAAVTFAVLVTGNHWWLDAVLGAAVAAASAWAAHSAFARLRPEVWAWQVGARVKATA
jgi:hypothetical protein